MTGQDRRAVSAVVGLVLLIGIVAVGAIGLLALGGQIEEDTRAETESARIEGSFLELGSDLNAIARSNERERVIDLDLPDSGDAAVQERQTGRIRVTRTNFSLGTTTTLVNESIGSIRYESSETTYGYQAGAVFRGSGNGTRVVSNPAFEYSLSKEGGNPTLTLPIVTTVGPDSIPNGKVRATKKRVETPVNDDTIVENDLVSVSVQSEWYVGWAAYFRALAEKTDTQDTAVTVDHANETATLELIVPVTRRAVKGGVVSGSTQGTLTIANNIDVTSYNSSVGPFSSSQVANSDVIAAGNLTIENNINIGGDVEVGKELTITNNPTIQGNASYGSADPDPPDSYVNGWYAANSSVGGYDAVDTIIDAKVNQFGDDNDNGENGVISGDRINCASPCTLDSGIYYLEEIDESDLSGKTLVLDTTGGPINLVVDGEVEIDNAEIRVRGPSRANVYVDSERSGADCDKNHQSACDFEFHQSSLQVRDSSGALTDNAAQMWVYMDSESDAVIYGGAGPTTSYSLFTGVVFSPGRGNSPGATITVQNKGTVQGALVGDVYAASQNGELRYDRRLRNTETIVSSSKVPRLTFLIVSSYVVEVDDD